MEGTVRLGSIAGIPIGIHYTWIFAFFLIAWSAGGVFFPTMLPGQPVVIYVVMGVAASLGLFLSVLIHELSHSIVALRFGLAVQGITLFIFGGVSLIKSEAEEPRHEFLISIVGPIASLVIGALCGALYLLSGQPLVGQIDSPLWALVWYLAFVNVAVGIFNMLPGFPLDGGRVLRSILWKISGSLVKATTVASIVGQVFGWLLIAFGVYQLFAGNLLGGIWMALIGWFLNGGAEASRRETLLRDRFKHVPIAPLIRPDPPAISPFTPVSDLVHKYLVQQGLRALPVLNDEDGRVVGIVSITDVKAVPPEAWDHTRVESVMTRGNLVEVGPDTGLADVLQLLNERDINQLIVVEDGHLVGMISRADIMRFMQIREELGPESLQDPHH